MRLLRLSEHAHTLETSAGSLLFSYEGLTAVRLHGAQGAAVFRSPRAILSMATRTHLHKFAPGSRLPPVLSARQFYELVSRVLSDPGAVAL